MATVTSLTTKPQKLFPVISAISCQFTGQRCALWEETTHGPEHQESRIPGSPIVETAYHSLPLVLNDSPSLLCKIPSFLLRPPKVLHNSSIS